MPRDSALPVNPQKQTRRGPLDAPLKVDAPEGCLHGLELACKLSGLGPREVRTRIKQKLEAVLFQHATKVTPHRIALEELEQRRLALAESHPMAGDRFGGQDA